jgi:hypothetical protein
MAALSPAGEPGPVKMLYIGDSSTGKTGSLVSLVKEGFKIKMLDMDVGIGTLKSFTLKECPERIGQLDAVTPRDEVTVGPSPLYGGKSGPKLAGAPKAFTEALGFLDKWDDGSNPAEWGLDTIFVLDSLSAFGKAAFNWAQGLNPGSKDPRQWYFAAQKGVEDTIAALTDASFKTNVIVISHINYREVTEGVHKGYTNAIGSALGPVIPRYFNTLVAAESNGFGKNVKRTIKTVPTGLIDLKTPVSHTVDVELPLESGMATLFNLIRKAA